MVLVGDVALLLPGNVYIWKVGIAAVTIIILTLPSPQLLLRNFTHTKKHTGQIFQCSFLKIKFCFNGSTLLKYTGSTKNIYKSMILKWWRICINVKKKNHSPTNAYMYNSIPFFFFQYHTCIHIHRINEQKNSIKQIIFHVLFQENSKLDFNWMLKMIFFRHSNKKEA